MILIPFLKKTPNLIGNCYITLGRQSSHQPMPQPVKLQEIKTGAREYVQIFERGIVKNNLLGNSLFI